MPVISPSKLRLLNRSYGYLNRIHSSTTGAAANGEIQSERLLLARSSISAVACMLDYSMKHLQQESSTMNSVTSRLAMALAGCAQRSVLGIRLVAVISMNRMNDSIKSIQIFLFDNKT